MIGIPKPLSRASEKQDARKLRESYRRVIYRLVSKRDQYQCRHCHARTGLHHHHIRRRSQQGQDSEQNIVLLCQICHADVHAYRLFIVGTDANRLLGFRQR
jgi:5-methylcytosine-specific restriction endonuclease McrA